jgi:hypothetical protein
MEWLKLLEILWAWPTVAAIAIAVFHGEFRTLLVRVASTSKAKFGSLELEMPIATPSLDPQPLERVDGKEFLNGVVELDGKEFVNCRFE